MNKWGNMPYNVLGMQYSTCLFLIWHVWVRASAIACLSHTGQKPFFEKKTEVSKIH